MAAPRKIFRIEETSARRYAVPVDDDDQAGQRHAEMMGELGALRAMMAPTRRPAARRPTAAPATTAPAESTRLSSELNLIHGAINGDGADVEETRVSASSMTRIARELEAIVHGSERATQKILAAAEEIDQVANNLSAALKGRIEQGLADDIQDIVIKVFEACNFQDLIGQRVAKVMARLNFIEDHIARVLDEIKSEPLTPVTAAHDDAQLLHGPRLEGDSGHASQDDVDALFNSD